MKQQAYNPFLPLWEYIPDGEPHIFGDRIYLFGSHDEEGGQRYCSAGNYVGWSAPLDDLSDWRCEGVIYTAEQDPHARPGVQDLYAPDVVQGNDGRYYLYYTLSGPGGEGFKEPISVAVCDTPAGKYEYLGVVRHPDGQPFLTYITADPAVINDEGTIRLYYGWGLSMVAGAAHGRGEANHAALKMSRQQLLPVERMLFKRTDEELLSLPEDIMGANTVVLEDDMMTVRGEPSRIVPSQFNSLDTGFDGHAFYEAASIRKINGIYYFIYSSQESNELCYATSEYPDRAFRYGGTIISNGDVGYQGREPEHRLNMTANDHGSLECIKGQWYIFHHRQTHNSTFSRQACAEPVQILPDGSICQVEMTSCGLNAAPLKTEGTYPAPIACNLTNGKMPHATNRVVNADIPYITHEGTGKGALRFITNLKEGCMAGYKYFAFNGPVRLAVTVRGASGVMQVVLGDTVKGDIELAGGQGWYEATLDLDHTGTAPLYLVYHGEGPADLLQFGFEPLPERN